jgi:hypothetical protein
MAVSEGRSERIAYARKVRKLIAAYVITPRGAEARKRRAALRRPFIE